MKWDLLDVSGNTLLDLLLTVIYASKSIISYVILLMIFTPLFWKLSRTNDDTGLALLKASWLTFIPTIIWYYLGIFLQSTYSTSIKFIHGEFIILYVTLLALGTGLLYYDRTEQ